MHPAKIKEIKFKFSMIINYDLIYQSRVDQVLILVIITYNPPRLGRVKQISVFNDIAL